MFFKFLTIGLFCTVTTAYASEQSVEVTSFKFAVTRGHVAELCGKVSGIEGLSLIKILVDPKSKNPANYTVVVDSNGSFCTSLVTYSGEAEASVGNSKKFFVVAE